MRKIQKQKSKYSNKKSRRIERYSAMIFKLAGIALMILAGYYFFEAEKNQTFEQLTNILSNKSNKINDGSNLSFSWDTFNKLLSCFIPGLLGLVAALFFSKKHHSASYYLSLFLILFLTVTHATIFVENWLPNYNFAYHNYYIVSGFLILPITAFFINYWHLKKGWLLTFITLYFYTLLFELLIFRYSFTYLYIFTCILLYSSTLYFVSKKHNDTFNNFLNALFAYGFFIIFVIRQLIINKNDSSLALFLFVSTSLFLLFHSISLTSLFQERKPFYKLFYWLNIALYLGINAVVFTVFSNISHNLYSLFIVIAANGFAIYLSKKLNHLNGKIFSVELSTILLLALFSALLFHNYSFDVFLGTLVVLLIIYAKIDKNVALVWIATMLSLALILKLIYLIISLSLIVAGIQVIDENFILKGFVNVGVISLSIWGVKRNLETVQFRLSNKWLNRDQFVKLLTFFSFIGGFTLINWICFSLLFEFAGSLHYAFRVFIIIGGLSLVCIDKFRKPHFRISKNILYYLSFFYLILICVLGLYEFPYLIKYNITYYNVITTENLFHYTELIIEIYLAYKTVVHFKILNHEKEYLRQLVVMTICIIAMVVLCKEYDYSTVLIDLINHQKFTMPDTMSIISNNQILPYSIIFLISSIIILLIGFIDNNKFLRLFSFFVAVSVLIKVFYIEYFILTKNEKTTIIMIIGVTFLLISSIYNRRRQKRKIRELNHRSTTHHNDRQF